MTVISNAGYLTFFAMESTGTHWPAAGSRVWIWGPRNKNHTSTETRTSQGERHGREAEEAR